MIRSRPSSCVSHGVVNLKDKTTMIQYAVQLSTSKLARIPSAHTVGPTVLIVAEAYTRMNRFEIEEVEAPDYNLTSRESCRKS